MGVVAGARVGPENVGAFMVLRMSISGVISGAGGGVEGPVSTMPIIDSVPVYEAHSM
jgi:hypothetical protein